MIKMVHITVLADKMEQINLSPTVSVKLTEQIPSRFYKYSLYAYYDDTAMAETKVQQLRVFTYEKPICHMLRTESRKYPA